MDVNEPRLLGSDIKLIYCGMVHNSILDKIKGFNERCSELEDCDLSIRYDEVLDYLKGRTGEV